MDLTGRRSMEHPEHLRVRVCVHVDLKTWTEVKPFTGMNQSLLVLT